MSLTGANSVIIISADDLGLQEVLQGFSADDVFDADQVKRAETSMGVDGFLSAGWVWEEIKQTFTMQADSPSNTFWDTVQYYEAAIADKYVLSATITLPGINSQFTAFRGFLVESSPIPGVGKLIKPRKFTVHWNQLTPVAIASQLPTGG